MKVPKKRQKLDESVESEESVKIYVANKIFVQKGLKILANYRKLIQDDFGSELEEVNFEENFASIEKINKFVKNSTKDMITEILSPNDINAQTKAAIINAIYFNGLWEKPFDGREKETFYSNPKREIDFMTTRPENGDWNFQKGINWRALGIPYRNRKTWIQKSKSLGVTIPLIEVSTTLDLPENLNKLGIIDAFDERCNLSKMFLVGEEPTFIGKAIHKAAIKVSKII
uniref:Serpin domain-containing protein n=1 Tax=Panagrolaimus superbus TaxID=310955 RepID=A0A914Y395_9BILA